MMNIDESVSDDAGAAILQGLAEETDIYVKQIMGG